MGNLKSGHPAVGKEADVLHGIIDSTRRVGNIGTWQGHPGMAFALWSPEMYRILRLPQGTGQEPLDRFQSMVIEEDQPVVASILDALQTAGSYSPVTLRLRGGDGSMRHLISSGQRTPASDHTAAFYVGINIDVTEHIEQQARLAATQSTVARHAGVINSLLEHMPIGLAIAVDGEILQVSRFATDMIGMGVEEGTDWDAWQIYQLDGVTPARREEQALHRAAQGEIVRMEQWYVRTATGTLLPVACNAGPIRGHDGGILGAIVAWYDVSAFKDAEQSERVARMAAETAVRQREKFAAVVAHELRTPLTAVSGWIEMLRRNPSLLARGLPAISASTQGMARILDDFTDVARIDSGKLVLTRRPADLATVVQTAVDALQPIATGAGVVIEWSRPLEPVNLLADPLRLQQALLNLLGNAVKYSSQGGLVLVTLEDTPGLAVIRISDYGQGIEADDLERIFDEYFQGDRTSAKKGGLGLGLTIARHIVQRHGGSLRAESAGLGRGATFTLQLPLS